MNVDACYQLGYVLKAHGLKGEAQLLLDVDIPENYSKLESVFIEIDKKLVPFFIEQILITKSRAVVKFEDIDTLEKAEELKGKSIFLPLNNLPPLQDDQFYYHELIDFRIIDEKEGPLGIIVDIYNLPQQDLMAIHYKEKEVLIPLNDEILLSVDRENKEVHVSLPEGLLQVYLEE